MKNTHFIIVKQILFICVAASLITLGWQRLTVKPPAAPLAVAAAVPVSVHYKREMADLIVELYNYGKSKKPAFELIGNNASDLFAESAGYTKTDIDRLADSTGGILLESFFFGVDMMMNKESAEVERKYIRELLSYARKKKKPIFNIDYCNASKIMINSAALNKKEGFIGFAAVDRELRQVPLFPFKLAGEGSGDIAGLGNVKNFLCLLDSSAYRDKEAYLNALRDTNFDLLIIDLYYNDSLLTPEDVISLQKKKNGGRRLVYSYMSIGEAENYRYYWQKAWSKNRPGWLEKENPNWEGNYKVRYWDGDWKGILFGDADNSYLDRILSRGFDGAFLDVVDSWVYFTELAKKKDN